MGGASQSQLKCFLFEQHSTPKLSDVRKDAQNHNLKNSEVLQWRRKIILKVMHKRKRSMARSAPKKFCSLIFMSMQFSPFYLRSDIGSTSIITTMFQMYNAKEKERKSITNNQN